VKSSEITPKEVLQMDDKRIVELYFERSEQAVSETASKYGKYCYSIAYNILDNNEDAEESVNDTYVDAWNSIPPHRPSILSTFLGKITRRISIDRWRKGRAEKRGGGEMPLVLEELQECVADDHSVEQDVEKRCLSDIINTFVISLPETEQKVFVCRYWYMDSVDFICKQFGFSESKVKSMLYRTREKLRVILSKEGFQ
jgi:RNA polymerase sigma factor, sigma-70 family